MARGAAVFMMSAAEMKLRLEMLARAVDDAAENSMPRRPWNGCVSLYRGRRRGRSEARWLTNNPPTSVDCSFGLLYRTNSRWQWFYIDI